MIVYICDNCKAKYEVRAGKLFDTGDIVYQYSTSIGHNVYVENGKELCEKCKDKKK